MKDFDRVPVAATPANLPAVQTMDIATSRSVQEVQAAVISAKNFPRDPQQALQRVLAECERPILAESAMYAYPKGGTMVTGPSIRLAEVLARNWGNMEAGVIELDNSGGQSVMQAFCWDQETNFRQTKTFTVKHHRDTKQGGYALTDQRDIYELTANQAARRLRACILSVIPGDIQDAAVDRCNKTLSNSGGGKSIAERVQSMLNAFMKYRVTEEMIEERLGHNLAATTEQEVVSLGSIYNSLKDNMSVVPDWFKAEATQAPSKPDLTAKKPETVDDMAAEFEAAEAALAADEGGPRLDDQGLPVDVLSDLEHTPAKAEADPMPGGRVRPEDAATTAEAEEILAGLPGKGEYGPEADNPKHVEPEKPKRTRRTKAQMQAARDAEKDQGDPDLLPRLQAYAAELAKAGTHRSVDIVFADEITANNVLSGAEKMRAAEMQAVRKLELDASLSGEETAPAPQEYPGDYPEHFQGYVNDLRKCNTKANVKAVYEVQIKGNDSLDMIEREIGLKLFNFYYDQAQEAN